MSSAAWEQNTGGRGMLEVRGRREEGGNLEGAAGPSRGARRGIFFLYFFRGVDFFCYFSERRGGLEPGWLDPTGRIAGAAQGGFFPRTYFKV